MLAPALVSAQNGTGIDAQENVFGATNINATTGHGGLTVGVSREGDITVLSWPTPSLIDQLGYLSSNDLDARDQPHFGAPDGAGIFLGLSCEVAGTREALWFRDADEWDVSQDYGVSDGPNPRTTFSSARFNLEVTQVDAVSPTSDVLVRHVRVFRMAGFSPASDCSLLTYANLSPQPATSRVPGLPLSDWAMDGRNDYAAVWSPDDSAVLHFHPSGERTYESIGDAINPAETDFGPVGEALVDPAQTLDDQGLVDLVDQLDATPGGSDAFAFVTTVPSPDQHQVGFDQTPFCDQIGSIVDNIRNLSDTFPDFRSPFPDAALDLLLCRQTGPELVVEQGWAPRQDPWTDAQDGELSNDSIAAGEVASALRTPLDFGDGNDAEASVVISFASNPEDARTAMRTASASPKDVVDAAEQFVGSWLEGVAVPGEPGTRHHQVARRALLNLRVGTDTESGAIVASIARQPPYYLDWPRDGAFFNVMLDASGQHALVEQRNALYENWQRAEAVRPLPTVQPPAPTDPSTGLDTMYPADAWEMNYYNDGAYGGTFRFEIDTTAFAVWALVAHAGWADDPEEYLGRHWDAIERGADLLARWRDAETGLHAPAQEDDQANHSQTLHGAVTVFGALDIAARAARLLDRNPTAQRWEARATELRTAIEANFYSEDEDAFFMQKSGRLPLLASGQTAVGPTAWLVWPMTLYPLDDPAITRQLERDLALIQPALDLTAKGGLYYMKNTISLAVAGRPMFFEAIEALPETLASQATADTHQFGEVMVVDNSGPEPVAQQRVSTPHLWEGALYYLTVLAVEDPSALLKYDEVLPPSNVLPRPEPPSGGDIGVEDAGTIDADMSDLDPGPTIGEVRGESCNCSTGNSSPGTLLLAFLFVAIPRIRRR